MKLHNLRPDDQKRAMNVATMLNGGKSIHADAALTLEAAAFLATLGKFHFVHHAVETLTRYEWWAASGCPEGGRPTGTMKATLAALGL